MEEKTREQLEELERRISTVQTESDEFIRAYILKSRSGLDYIPNGEGYENKMNLAYKGDDTGAILRLFKEYRTQFYPDFKIDQTNIRAIEYMAKIAANKAEKQGIILHGPVGSGKTMLLLLWTEFIQKVMYRQLNAYYFTPTKLAEFFIKDGYRIFSRPMGQTLILDDIGINTEGTYFGTRTNILAEVIYNRYDRFKKIEGLEIYCSTNLLSEDLQEIIGERAWSRLQEMTEWNEGVIAADDRRIGTPAKRWPQPKYEDFAKPLDISIFNDG